MRILFEVLDRDRFDIIDPAVPAAAEPAKILHEAGVYDTVRILLFDPIKLTMSDLTESMILEYRGDFDDTAPLWVKQHPLFETLASEESREAAQWSTHLRAFRHAA